MELTLRVEYWASGPGKSQAKDIAHECLLQELYGNVRHFIPSLRMAIYNGETELAMELLNEIEEATKP